MTGEKIMDFLADTLKLEKKESFALKVRQKNGLGETHIFFEWVQN